MNTKIKRIVVTAMLAALTCIATMIIKIPSPLKGYLNLGDCIVLTCGWLLSPVYGFIAAGLGSAMADVFSGYMIYAPATFIIKGAMALVAFYGFKLLNTILGIGKLPSEIISGIVSEIIMILGYFVFEGFNYGFVASLVNIPANAIQGAIGVFLGIIIINLLKKMKLYDK